MNGIRSVSFQEVPGGLLVHVRKESKTSTSGKLKKRLPYNFKLMSKQIMQAKTSTAARPLVTKMQAKLSWLYKKLRSGEFGDSEVAAAIIHAASMERIAKRKVRHRNEEERQITRADLKYLKALFDRLEQEKKQAASGVSSASSGRSSSVSYVIDCMPEVEMTDMDLGEVMDVCV
jgi:hypothetical protein